MNSLFQSIKIRTAFKIILFIFIIFLLFLIFVYYKVKIKKCAQLNVYVSICYDNRFNSGCYRINGMEVDTKDSSLFGYNLFEEYYMDEDKFYYFIREASFPPKTYYLADLKTLNVRVLNPDEIVVIKNKATVVRDIAYKSPYWLLIRTGLKNSFRIE